MDLSSRRFWARSLLMLLKRNRIRSSPGFVGDPKCDRAKQKKPRDTKGSADAIRRTCIIEVAASYNAAKNAIEAGRRLSQPTFNCVRAS
jgi:hypothetical protein